MLDESVEAIERRADSLIDNHDHLLRRLVALRKQHHLTQLQVAERMGVSQPTVAGFERYDANPTLSTIRRYALAVGARIEERVHDDCCQVETAFAPLVASFTPAVTVRPLHAIHWGEPSEARPVRYAAVHA